MNNNIGMHRRPQQHNLERERAAWTEKKVKAGTIAQKLRAIGKISRYFRMKDCTDTIISDVCERCENRYVIQTTFCRDRLCPICSWCRARRLAHRIGEIIAVNEAEKHSRYALLTLTVRNVAWDKLAEEIKAIMESWRRMDKRIMRAAAVIGWFRAFEVMRSNDNGDAHPHLHILLQVPPEYFDQDSKLYLFHRKDELIRQWQECLHVNYAPSISIKAIKDNEIGYAVAEATKYIAKESGIEKLSDADFRSYVEAVHGSRAWSTGGRMRISDDEIEASLHDDNPASQKGTCRHCGGRLFEMREVWSATGKAYTAKFEAGYNNMNHAHNEDQASGDYIVNLNINSGGGNIYVGNDISGGHAGDRAGSVGGDQGDHTK